MTECSRTPAGAMQYIMRTPCFSAACPIPSNHFVQACNGDACRVSETWQRNNKSRKHHQFTSGSSGTCGLSVVWSCLIICRSHSAFAVKRCSYSSGPCGKACGQWPPRQRVSAAAMYAGQLSRRKRHQASPASSVRDASDRRRTPTPPPREGRTCLRTACPAPNPLCARRTRVPSGSSASPSRARSAANVVMSRHL